MKYHIAILAGGLGSRLNNTESMPKPLVDINGLSLLSKIIISLNKTELFKKFHILTCCNNGLYEKILQKEIYSVDFLIYNEIKRSGRIGAIKYFLNSQDYIDNFFVCNGDTIFTNLIASEIENPLNGFTYNPIAYLAKPDHSRSDYKSIPMGEPENVSEHQNSGLFFMNRDWFMDSIVQYPNASDIDELLFSSKESSKLSLLSTSLLDAGTPERLSYIRRLLNCT